MMKTKLLFIGVLTIGLAFTACEKDEDSPAACGAPTDLLVDARTQSSITISYVSGGSSGFNIEYGASGFTQGEGTEVQTTEETYTITGLESNTAYDIYVQGTCSDNSSGFISISGARTLHPLVGFWEAYDVSILLGSLGIDGITADFKENNSYVVVSSAGGASTTFEGTYAVSNEPNAGGIYSITLTQTAPSSLTSEGILQVFPANPDSMWYEVAQTNPSIVGVTPPTADAGFGSTSGGAFGTTNIQKYNRQ